MKDSINRKIIKGISWNVFERVSSIITSLLITFILVRLLSPDDFGMVAMVAVFSGLGSFFVDSGFKALIISEKEITQVQLSSIFWTTLGIAVFLFILFICCAELIVAFYNNPDLKEIVYVVSFLFILYALKLVPDSLYSKEMNFKILAKRNVVSNIIAGIIAIAMAYRGFGYWSLVFQRLINLFTANVLLWYQISWRPNFAYSISYIKTSIAFSSSIMINGIFGYIIENLDNILIGKYMGKTSLGIYSKSYSIINLPAVNIRSTVNRVLFPAMVKVQDVPEKVSKLLSTAMRYILIFSVPIMAIVALNAELFTLIIFGEKWIAQVPLVKMFAIGGIFYGINNLFFSLLVIKKETKKIFYSNLLRRGVVLFSLLSSFPFGLEAIAFGRVIAEIINLGICFYYIKDILGTGIGKQIQLISPYLITASIVALIQISFFQGSLSSILILDMVLKSIIFLFLYFTCLFLFFPSEYPNHFYLVKKVGTFFQKKTIV